MSLYDMLAMPLTILSIGVALGLLVHGPSIITINKHYHNDKDE